jgi:hypothetical protein
VTRLEPGERARDEEAHRAEDVGPPDVMLGQRRAVGCPDRDEGADVELEGSQGLNPGGQPVDLAGQPDEDLPTGRIRPPGSGVDRLAVLQEAGRGEEDRSDEVRHGVSPSAHGVRVRGHRAETEQERADREQDADPPVAILRRPPCRAARPGSRQVLAVRTGFPARDHPVRALADDVGDERPEPAFLRRFCFWAHRNRLRSGPWFRSAPPVATGRAGSVIHWDHEPTYSAAGIPASAKARTSWAAVTPEPQ